MTRVFFDMDGVLAEYKYVPYEEMLKDGYFYNLAPQQEAIEAMRTFAGDPTIEVHTLSAVIEECEYALPDKQRWLEEHIPFLNEVHVNYLPCGKDKTEAVPGGIRPTDILIDDYNKNLLAWKEKAVAIKYLNGVNNRHGSWKGLTAGGEGKSLEAAVYEAIEKAEKAS